uniref:Uncharacterized protein n=1 Tax=Siphoviridae sp. ctsi73 TaxID=2825698 RepID=A0A8S5QHZ5_9CAUD|nr:MAG TPA: hypothetical protein [Siphoviridae sp. ctsi73]
MGRDAHHQTTIGRRGRLKPVAHITHGQTSRRYAPAHPPAPCPHTGTSHPAAPRNPSPRTPSPRTPHRT